MKRSSLSKVVGASVISINLVVLPLAIPAFAQTSGSNASNQMNAGSSTTRDPNIDPNINSTNNNSNYSNSNNNAAPSPGSSTFTSNSASNTGSSMNGSSSTSGDNSNSASNSTSSTSTPAQTTNAGNASWGWLGIFGLIGLAGLMRKPGIWKNFKMQRERRAEEKEERDIKNALGRPSKRVILDKQDNVILNVGDLITNLAIERARAADMLDVLLDSVDTQDPEITNDERTAPVPGEASLEEQQSHDDHPKYH